MSEEPSVDTGSSEGHSPSRNLADSPWFWFALFGLMALAALLVVGPKFAKRQSQLERNYQGRRDAWEQRVRKADQQTPPTPADTPSESP